MDLLAHIQMMRVPLWARIIIYGGFLALFAVSGYLAWSAIDQQGRDSWLGASVALFAAIFPLMVVILIATTIHAGVKAIKDHTDRFLVVTLPRALSRIAEDSARFVPLGDRDSNRVKTRFADVEVNHCRGDCYADYKLSYTDDANRALRLLIRIELNVKRLNFNLYLPIAATNSLVGAQGTGLLTDMKLEPVRTKAFRHTLEAATISDNLDEGDETTTSSGGYIFYHQIFNRVLEGKPWYIMVGSRKIARDTLWNPAERLFIAQDLMFMVRAMASEGALLFVEE
jgi:hypothetical protein